MSAPRRPPFTLLLLAADDDVAIAVRSLLPGTHRTSADQLLRVSAPVAWGHKVAVRPLRAGAGVVRSGMVIGSVTADVAAGEWVHTHNLVGSYTAPVAHRGGAE